MPCRVRSVVHWETSVSSSDKFLVESVVDRIHPIVRLLEVDLPGVAGVLLDGAVGALELVA